MTTLTITLEGEALASRDTGARVRCEVAAAIDSGRQVVLDFASVQCVSEAWADEAIGVLVHTKSLGWFFQKIVCRGLTPAVSGTIVAAIRRRLARENTDALLAGGKPFVAGEST